MNDLLGYTFTPGRRRKFATCAFAWIMASIPIEKEKFMLLRYLQAAMAQAKYEILADDGQFYGEISVCEGVYSNEITLEKCREVLAEVLEEWVLFRIHQNLNLPSIDGRESKILEVA